MRESASMGFRDNGRAGASFTLGPQDVQSLNTQSVPSGRWLKESTISAPSGA